MGGFRVSRIWGVLGCWGFRVLGGCRVLREVRIEGGLRVLGFPPLKA